MIHRINGNDNGNGPPPEKPELTTEERRKKRQEYLDRLSIAEMERAVYMMKLRRVWKRYQKHEKAIDELKRQARLLCD